MKKLLLLIILVTIGSAVASDIDHVQALFESPWSTAGDPPDWLQLLSDMQRIGQVDLTLEEWVVVLGPGHNYNVTREGTVTLGDGSMVDITLFNHNLAGLRRAEREGPTLQGGDESGALCPRIRLWITI
jgi:hypothetical protein